MPTNNHEGDNKDEKKKIGNEGIAQLKARLAAQGFNPGVAKKAPSSSVSKHPVVGGVVDKPVVVDSPSLLSEADIASAAKEVESEVKLSPAEMRAKLGLPPVASGGPRMPLGGIMGGVKLKSVETKIVEAKGKVIDAPLPAHDAPTQAAPTSKQEAPSKAPNFAAEAASMLGKLKSRAREVTTENTGQPKSQLSELQQKLADRRAAAEKMIDIKEKLTIEKSSRGPSPSDETKASEVTSPTPTHRK